MNAFIHPFSDVQSKNIGEGMRIWQFCVVLPGAKIGKNCNIRANCFIENDVFIGVNTTLCNDLHPKTGSAISSVLESVVLRPGRWSVQTLRSCRRLLSVEKSQLARVRLSGVKSLLRKRSLMLQPVGSSGAAKRGGSQRRADGE